MKKFTEIGQFRNVIREVKTNHDYQGKDENGDAIYLHTSPYPVLKFRGTVKSHGTNSAIVKYKNALEFVEKDNSLNTVFEFQSRERILGTEGDDDNCGFMKTMLTKDYRKLFEGIEFNNYCAIYGEWCGCFPYKTPILLSDGITMTIGKIVKQKLNVEVLTYNKETGNLEAKKVINWYQNGKTDKWLKINVKRRKRGGKSTGFIVTPNHKIFVKENNNLIEKFASELNIHDKVLVHGNILTHNIKQFLMGTLLGDGSFSTKRNIQLSHSDDDQKFYNDFIENNLNHLFTKPHTYKSGYGSNMKTFISKAFSEIEDLYNKMYKNKKTKQATIEYLNKLSPLALATWYMDDGSLIIHNKKGRQYRCAIHCQGFGENNVKLIASWFNSRGYFCNIVTENKNNKEKGAGIAFTFEGASSFLYTIAPYILESFNYKLPEILQKIEKVSWWKHYLNEYDQSLVEAVIENIEEYFPTEEYLKNKYDIEVEDNHNYFANRVLVHNSGIQKGVAVSELPKTYIIFAIKIDDVYQDIKNFKHLKIEEENIFNILQFPTFSIEIDFNNPDLSQNILVELTTAVEKECPIGKYFGISGTGEGIVWEYVNSNERYIFKVKGEKHQNSKVKTLTTVNTEEIQNIKAFVDYAVTENRLLQGVDKMKELGLSIDTKTTGDYLRWVYNDVIKEESDTIAANGIDVKKIGSAVSEKSRIFWFNYLNTHLNEK